MIKVSIIGASGYTGLELIRILSSHPEVEIDRLCWSREGSIKIDELFPGLKSVCSLECSYPDLDSIGKNSDAVFLAVPHKAAMDYVRKLSEYKIKIIDLSADFRIDSPDTYSKWYDTQHSVPELLEKFVYGLPELNREKIKNSEYIANPGCYPTCSILGIAPLLKNRIITNDIIIDAKSGVSGAGKKLSDRTHFSETNDSFCAYSIKHRHFPEIKQELEKLNSGNNINLSFIPHLIPINRGMLCSIYANPAKTITTEELENIYSDFYKNDFFVRVSKILPETKFVRYSNFCDIKPVYDSLSGKIIVISVIDNICKGASGQAVQNMNLMFGLDEKTGLMFPGIYP